MEGMGLFLILVLELYAMRRGEDKYPGSKVSNLSSFNNSIWKSLRQDKISLKTSVAG